MAEPTGAAYTFGDLQIRVAEALGIAYYGALGTLAAAVPVDAHDLDRVKRIINSGIKMYIADGPPAGWSWMTPYTTVTLWPDVAVDALVTATGVFVAETTITASAASFYPSMEAKNLTVTGETPFTVDGYTSPTVVTHAADVSWVGGKTFLIASDGNFTLPSTFGGVYSSPITFVAGSDLGVALEWVSPAEIRRQRENSTATGTPYLAAVEKMGASRRWQLSVYPTPSAEVSVAFQYPVYFAALTAATDLHPAGLAHDDCILAACLAAGERDGEELLENRMEYYLKVALPNGKKIDARTAPRTVGYCGNPGRRDGRDHRRRPTVSV